MINSQLDFMQKFMGASNLQRQTIANNISNINTPNFKSTEVSFDNLFDQQMGDSLITNQSNQIPSTFGNEGQVTMTQDTSSQARPDGNNVDLNTEMVNMIKNNYLYGLSVQGANQEFSLEKTAMGK